MDDLLRQYLYLLLAFALVLLNGFFTAAEFAFIKIRASRLETLARRGNIFAKSARHVANNIDAYLSLTQLGITAASLGLGWIGEPAVAAMLRPILSQVGIGSEAAIHSFAFVIAFLSITFLHIVLGELAPKLIAIQRSEGIALAVAVPLQVLRIVFYPVALAFECVVERTSPSRWSRRRGPRRAGSFGGGAAHHPGGVGADGRGLGLQAPTARERLQLFR